MIAPRHRLVFLVSLLALGLTTGCSTMYASGESGFTYRAIPIATDSVAAGDGSFVSFRGQSLPLSGPAIAVGDSLRSAEVVQTDLARVDIASTRGRIRIISVVPSLDTRVCEQQTHYLSENHHGLDRHIALITISIDTPFAQARFAREAGIHNVTYYSDYRGGAFGKAHGLFLDDLHVLARAVMVVDRDNIVRHLQITPDLGKLPDMDAAFAAAKALLDSSTHP